MKYKKTLVYTVVRRLFVSFLLILVIGLRVFAQINLPPDTKRVLERFESKIKESAEQDGIGSITAAVVFGDTVVWSRSYGWADSKTHSLASTQNIYRIGSISKSITATVLVLLAERAILKLDDPVEKFVPEIRNLANSPEDAAYITLRQLANHTSGLATEPNLPGASTGPFETWEQKVLASIPTTSLENTPGQQYLYSNIGYGILGLAIGRAANKSFIDLVVELLFEPLQMDHSTFTLTPEQNQLLATGYSNSIYSFHTVNEALPAEEHIGRGYRVPNGGVYSTVTDMAKFVAAQTGAVQLISESGRAELHRFYTSEESETGKRGYGLGFSLDSSKTDGAFYISHNGLVEGYSASFYCELDSRIGVILLRNYNVGTLNLDCAGSLLQELVELHCGETQSRHNNSLKPTASAWHAIHNRQQPKQPN